MPARLSGSRALACGLGLALLLQGCESRWVETRDVGVLRLTEYWSRDRLDWEGGNTFVRRTTLCVRDRRRCLEDRLLTLDPDPELEPPAPRWIHVTGLEDETLSRFLDTETGAELACVGCEGSRGGSFPPDIGIGGTRWSLSRDHAVTGYTDPQGKRTVFAWLGFSPTGVTLRRIDPLASEDDRLIGPWISADGSAVAWYACGETCLLHSVEVTTGRTESRDTRCPFNDYLELAWNGNVPAPQYDWGGGLGYIRDTLCRDAEGNIAFPIASPP